MHSCSNVPRIWLRFVLVQKAGPDWWRRDVTTNPSLPTRRCFVLVAVWTEKVCTRTCSQVGCLQQRTVGWHGQIHLRCLVIREKESRGFGNPHFHDVLRTAASFGFNCPVVRDLFRVEKYFRKNKLGFGSLNCLWIRLMNVFEPRGYRAKD